MATHHEAVLLVDGSALFLASREIDTGNPLNYLALSQLLQRATGATALAPAIFWTSFDPSNEGQAKFLEFVRNRLGWTVDAVPVQDAEARPGMLAPSGGPWIRFGERIAYAVGRISAQGKPLIIVISDQYGLGVPLLDAAIRGSSIWWAFFSSRMDPRVHRLLRDAEDLLTDKKGAGQIRLIDLDDYAPELWGSPRRAGSSETRGIGGFARLP